MRKINRDTRRAIRLGAALAASLALGAPAFAQQPIATVSAPADALVGEDFNFTVAFSNGAPSGGAPVGFGPFIDVAVNFGGEDDNLPVGAPGPCDGIDFLYAEMVGVNPSPLALKFKKVGNTDDKNCPATTAAHLYGDVAPAGLSFEAGWQVTTIALPFSSFESSQPAINVAVAAHMHDHADRDKGLEICTRGGFLYGALATGGSPILQSGASNSDPRTWTCTKVRPQVFLIGKTYLGPENETATGPNFVQQYKITLDIAKGQTVGGAASPLRVSDCMPDGMVYLTLQTPVPAPASWGTPSVTPPTGSPGCLTLVWSNAVVGGPGSDATIKIDFSIAEKFANERLILEDNCKTRLLNNTLRASGDWEPVDGRDGKGSVGYTNAKAHELAAKCLPIQKSVSKPPVVDTGAPGYTPGDTLQYTLNFQVSDYRTIGRIVISDQLSNGHRFIAGTAMLTVTDRFGSYTVPITPAVSTVPNEGGTPGCPSGAMTELGFDVSGRLSQIQSGVPRHQNGILTGGLAPSPPAAPPAGPATGTIVFEARIEDAYAGFVKPDGSIDERGFIDKHDPLCNTVTSQGAVYKNAAPGDLPGAPAPTQWARDNSGTQIAIVSGVFSKSIYAVRRGTNVKCGPGAAPCVMGEEVLPGDRVTFRLQYDSIPSGDAENITIRDWLPQPVFDLPTGSIPFSTTCSAAPPAVDAAKCGPSNTPGFLPGPIVVGTANDLTVDYGTVSDTANQPKKLDFLFSVRVTNAPFADDLFLTNEARECEDATFVKGVCKVAITQVKVREPKLGIRKGVIWHSNTQFPGVFSQPTTPASNKAGGPAGVTFSQNGVNGVVTSANLGTFFNSELLNVDAGDTAVFAIVIENEGGYPAFDVKLEDIGLADCFAIDVGSIKVRRGSGNNPIPAAATPATSPGSGFSLTLLNPIQTMNPAVTPNQTPPPGANIIIVTFKATMPAGLKAGCCNNEARLANYASKSGGPNFVPTGTNPGYGGPFNDTTRICSGPRAAEKCVRTTSEALTAPDSSLGGATPDVAIGEIVRYRLMTVIPEGVTKDLQVTDLLPVGMTYIPGSAKARFVANQNVANKAGILTVPSPGTLCMATWKPDNQISESPAKFPVGTGTHPSFPSGPITVTNTDNDAGREYLVVDLNAQVDNVVGNQGEPPTPTELNNSFEAAFDDVYDNEPTPVTSSSGEVKVSVVEPALSVTKTPTVTPISGNTSVVKYEVVITNVGSATAFDVNLTDILPGVFPPNSVTFSSFSAPANCLPSFDAQTNTVGVVCPTLLVGETIKIVFNAVAMGCSGPVTNAARVTWTSLPGPMGTPSSTTSAPTANQTGSSVFGASGAPGGERNGSTPGVEPNTYAKDGLATFTCGSPPPQTGLLRLGKRLDLPSGLIGPQNYAVSVKCTSPVSSSPVSLPASGAPMNVTVPAPNSCTITEDLTKLPALCLAGYNSAWTMQHDPILPIAVGSTQTITVTNTLNCTTGPTLPQDAAPATGQPMNDAEPHIYLPGEPAPNDNEAAVLNASEVLRIRTTDIDQ